MKLSITQKHILAALLFVACIAVLGAAYTREVQTGLRTAERARQGMSIFPQTLELMLYERLATLSKLADGRSAMASPEELYNPENGLSALRYLIADYRKNAQTRLPKLENLFVRIERSEAVPSTATLTKMLRLLSEDSRLMLNPLSGSSHLATLVSTNIPQQISHADDSLKLLKGLVADVQTADGRFKVHANTLKHDVAEMSDEVNAIMDAGDVPDSDRQFLRARMDEHQAAATLLIDALARVSPEITVKRFGKLVTATHDYLVTMQEVHLACVSVLRKLLDARADAKRDMIQFVLQATLIGLLVSCVVYGALVYSVVNPLRRLKDRIYAMANWDLESEVPERERIDDIGQIAFAIEVLRQNAKRFKELEELEAQHEARRRARQEQLEALVHSFEHSVVPLLDGVFESATQLHHTAERMKQSISVAQRNAGQVYESVGSSSQQIEAIAQSSDSIHRAIGEMVHRIHETLSMSTSALEETKDADQSTQELAQATRQISGVIALIRKITEKINLLALNAGIESIRAGEAGKGFVVVAQEVKTLATQTKRATEDIVDKILFLQEKTASTESALKQVRDGMLTLTETNQSLHSGIQDQQKLTNTIAYSMHQASGIMSGMDTSVGTINSKISEIDTASREVVDSARVLGSNANILTHEIRKFLREISAIDATLPADSAEDSTKAA